MKRRIAKKIIKQLVSDFDGSEYQIHQSLKAYHKLGKKYCYDYFEIEKVTLCNKIIRFENGQRVESKMPNPFLLVDMKMVALYDESLLDLFKEEI